MVRVCLRASPVRVSTNRILEMGRMVRGDGNHRCSIFNMQIKLSSSAHKIWQFPYSCRRPAVFKKTITVNNGRHIFNNGMPSVNNGTPIFINGMPIFINGTPSVNKGTPIFINGLAFFNKGWCFLLIESGLLLQYPGAKMSFA